MLDLFCGQLGWSKAFLARGWECVGVDLVEPPKPWPPRFIFLHENVLSLSAKGLRRWNFDFICASSPCEEFSVCGMKHFFPNPPPPNFGIELFECARAICEDASIPYVMENVRSAQKFVGKAVHHCGPYYLWGNAVPPIMPQGIIKGMTRLALGYREHKGQAGWNTKNEAQSSRKRAKENANTAATIPPELANCVADYAERLLELTHMSKPELLGSGPIPPAQCTENES